MSEDVLTLEILKRAWEIIRQDFPQSSTPLPILPSQWEDYKTSFHLTDEQMNRLFVKTEYLSTQQGGDKQ